MKYEEALKCLSKEVQAEVLNRLLGYSPMDELPVAAIKWISFMASQAAVKSARNFYDVVEKS